jgi:segregation and condensation protein A
MSLQKPVVIKISQFEGPLDLLLHLIHDAKIDIKEIFVSDITEQYLASLTEAELDIMQADTASAFLEMAALLLFIKSRSLLPLPPSTEGDEELSPEELLVRQLELHKKMKEAANVLRVSETRAALGFTKLPEELAINEAEINISNLTAEHLISAWIRLKQRVTFAEEAPRVIRTALSPSLRSDMFPFELCRDRLLSRLSTYASRGELAPFEELFPKRATRMEFVSLFIALLELIKQGIITASQSGNFDRIWVRKQDAL